LAGAFISPPKWNYQARLYSTIPTFHWKKQNKVWIKHKKQMENPIGRMTDTCLMIPELLRQH